MPGDREWVNGQFFGGVGREDWRRAALPPRTQRPHQRRLFSVPDPGSNLLHTERLLYILLLLLLYRFGTFAHCYAYASETHITYLAYA